MSGSSTSPAGAADVRVDVDDRQQAHEVDTAHLGTLLACTLAAQHGSLFPHGAEVGLAFIDADEMTDLNRAHMGGTGPTDVLAFPIDGAAGAHALTALADSQPIMFGDIVICPHVASRAPQPLDDELSLLVVHGALHLLGHDHAEPEETAIMQRIEREMLARFHAS